MGESAPEPPYWRRRPLLVAIAIAVVLAPVAHAQPNSASPPAVSLSSRPSLQRQRVVEECEVGGICSQIQSISDACETDDPCSDLEEVNRKTIRLQIPGFVPADRETHTYILSHLGDTRSGSSSATPDEDGVLSTERVVRATPGDETVWNDDQQFYFTAIDRNTLETATTLDLHQVRLWSFLNTLQNVRTMGLRTAGPRRTRPVLGGRQQDLDIRVSLRGERMTIDEVLDAIYLDSGCLVNDIGTALEIVSCP